MLDKAYGLFFGTLYNRNRLMIIKALEAGSKNVSEICDKTGMNQTTASHNLRRLERCGFVSVRQEGRSRIYSLNKETIKPLMRLIERHMDNHCRHILKNGSIKEVVKR